MKLDTVINNHIFKTLQKYRFNRTRTAEELGMSIKGLQNRTNKMRTLGFVFPEGRTGRPRVDSERHCDHHCTCFATNEERLSHADCSKRY